MNDETQQQNSYLNITEVLGEIGIETREDGSFYEEVEVTRVEEKSVEKEDALKRGLRHLVEGDAQEYYAISNGRLIVSENMFNMFDAFRGQWENQGLSSLDLITLIFELQENYIEGVRASLYMRVWRNGVRGGVSMKKRESKLLNAAFILKIYENYILKDLGLDDINSSKYYSDDLLWIRDAIKRKLIIEAREEGNKRWRGHYDG